MSSSTRARSGLAGHKSSGEARILDGGRPWLLVRQGHPRARGAEAVLRESFDRAGYVRVYDPERRRSDGQAYKKGFEVRLVAGSESEIRGLQECLVNVGLRPGRPFTKHSKIVLPVYGRRAVEWFRGKPLKA